MNSTELLTYLTPFVIWFVTWAITKLKPLLPGWLVATVIVPALAIILSFLTSLVVPDTKPVLQFVLGLGAIVISQFIKQLSPSKIAEDKSKTELKVG